jgi:hypothetical protein
VNQIYRLMDSARRRFTEDSRRWRPVGLTGARLTGAAEPGSSPRRGQKAEGTPVILTGCTNGGRGAEMGQW